jgi:hypothetical protein
MSRSLESGPRRRQRCHYFLRDIRLGDIRLGGGIHELFATFLILTPMNGQGSVVLTKHVSSSGNWGAAIAFLLAEIRKLAGIGLNGKNPFYTFPLLPVTGLSSAFFPHEPPNPTFFHIPLCPIYASGRYCPL